jgi:hypothetical protein
MEGKKGYKKRFWNSLSFNQQGPGNGAARGNLYGDELTVVEVEKKTTKIEDDLFTYFNERTKKFFTVRRNDLRISKLELKGDIINHYQLLDIDSYVKKHDHTNCHWVSFERPDYNGWASGKSCGDWFWRELSSSRKEVIKFGVDLSYCSSHPIMLVKYVKAVFDQFKTKPTEVSLSLVVLRSDKVEKILDNLTLTYDSLSALSKLTGHERIYFVLEPVDKTKCISDFMSHNEVMFFMSMIRTSYIGGSVLPTVWGIMSVASINRNVLDISSIFNLNTSYSHIPYNRFLFSSTAFSDLIKSLKASKVNRVDCNSFLCKHSAPSPVPEAKEHYDWSVRVRNRHFHKQLRSVFVDNLTSMGYDQLCFLQEPALLEDQLKSAQDRLDYLSKIKESIKK